MSACLSPTLPLPPPGEPEVAELSADRQTVRLARGHALRGAVVMLANLQVPDDMRWTFADSNGLYGVEKFPVDLSSSATNTILVWQTYGSDSSGTTKFNVPKRVAFGAPPVDDAGAATTLEGGPGDAGVGDAAE